MSIPCSTCTNTYADRLATAANSGVISLSCSLILVTFYVVILVSLRGQMLVGWHKAPSTCRSHTIVVILCLGPSTFVYIHLVYIPSPRTERACALHIITPMLNPFIYILWNEGSHEETVQEESGKRK
ncbi:hypothetical protein HGM15179_011278 [Zosterops borbonicus]|uniref:G-protein coupled receptors family 1 profile domain-containing protein n=1 Tax=Zosterops borbonicus TaxID=364589 RepID=A0A8K1GBX9_9PASS|nr:hypothetical protein HGM15179_011278 [Zosterops borbonicus]